MGQAAVNLWAEEAPENPQPFVYAVSLIKLLLRFSGFVLLRHNAWNPNRFNIGEVADKLRSHINLGLHIYLRSIKLLNYGSFCKFSTSKPNSILSSSVSGLSRFLFIYLSMCALAFFLCSWLGVPTEKL